MRIPLITFGLLFTSLLGLTGCGSSDTDGGGGTAGAPVELVFKDTSGGEARFSPDGATIAYVEQSTDSNSSLAVMTAAGEQRKPLAQAGGYLAGPAWSPDGKQIYFGSDAGISLVAASGGTESVAVMDFATMDPDVSPDGKSIVYGTNGGTLQLVDLATPTMHKDLGVNGTSPRFSPDGQSIAFQSKEMIQIMNLASSAVTDVVDSGTYLGSVDWFPDGKRLAITSEKGIEIVTLGATPERKLVREQFAAKDLDLSPDGKSIVYGINGKKSLFVLTGF